MSEPGYGASEHVTILPAMSVTKRRHMYTCTYAGIKRGFVVENVLNNDDSNDDDDDDDDALGTICNVAMTCVVFEFSNALLLEHWRSFSQRS